MKIMTWVVPALVLCSAAVSLAADTQWKSLMPEGTTAFVFGPTTLDGFTTVAPDATFNGDFGFASTDGLAAGGGNWPDPLTGGFVMQRQGKEYEFKARLPNGDYRVWICAGKVLNPANPRRFLLAAGNVTALDQTPDDTQFAGIDYLGRFLLTPSPIRPERIWQAYVNVMYPGTTHAVKVSGTQLGQQRADPVVAAVTAAGLELEATERHVQIVVHHHHAWRIDLPEARDAGHRLAADVHEFHRLAEKNAFRPELGLGDLGA